MKRVTVVLEAVLMVVVGVLELLAVLTSLSCRLAGSRSCHRYMMLMLLIIMRICAHDDDDGDVKDN